MFIYRITNIANNKVYIGQAKGVSVKSKWSTYRSQLKREAHPNCHLQEEWSLFGEDSFFFEIIDHAENRIQLDDLEKEWISKYDSTSRDLGYNIEAGGNRNKVLAQETRDKLSKTLKGRKRSEEQRKKMSEVISGEKHPQYGIPIPEECKKKISASVRKYIQENPITEDGRKKISAGLVGKKRKPFTDEHKRNISNAHKKRAIEGAPRRSRRSVPLSEEHQTEHINGT
jgi:group I intron endonuclease